MSKAGGGGRWLAELPSHPLSFLQKLWGDFPIQIWLTLLWPVRHCWVLVGLELLGTSRMGGLEPGGAGTPLLPTFILWPKESFPAPPPPDARCWCGLLPAQPGSTCPC